METDNILEYTKYDAEDNKEEISLPAEFKIPESVEESKNTEYAKHLNALMMSEDNDLDYSQLSSVDGLENFENIKDMTKIISLIRSYNNNENINYFDGLPEYMKQYVLELASSSPNKNISNNTIAKEFVKELAKSYNDEVQKSQSYDLDTIISGIDKEMDNNQVRTDIASSLRDLMYDVDEDRKANLDAGIKKYTEEGKPEIAQKFQIIKDSLDKAYNLTEFIDFCLHCKIKKFEILKPNKIYNHFNYKYDKMNRKYVDIYDISTCPDILNNHLPKYNLIHKNMLCIAFCKYSEKLDPKRIEDHTFMYYFIRNIILIDQINPKGRMYDYMVDKYKTFYDGFTENLSKCIFNLLERNITFK